MLKFEKLPCENIGTTLDIQTAKMNKELIKCRESDETIFILRGQIDHYTTEYLYHVI